MEIWYTYTGDIEEKAVGQAITWINGQIYQGAKKLKFLISSKGGDIDSAIRLYDYLKAIPLEVETIGFGQIDSSAVLIFLAGKKREAVKRCRFLFHMPTFTIGQPAASLRKHEESLEFFKELLRREIDTIAEGINKTTQEVEEILQSGKILTPEQAKDFGIVHEIIEKLPLTPQVVTHGPQVPQPPPPEKPEEKAVT